MASKHQKDQPFVPEINIDAAVPFKYEPPQTNGLDTESMMSSMIIPFVTMFMGNMTNVIVHWVIFFAMLSLFINRSNKSAFSQIGFSLGLVFVMIIFFYYKMHTGVIPLN